MRRELRGTLNLLQLKYFQIVARHEHITKAAQELMVSQPSLSNTIARLEADLGFPLFTRKGRQIKLTTYGQKYLERVNLALYELEKGQRELEEMIGSDKGTISLAITLPNALPHLLKEFLAVYPEAIIKQSQATSHDDIVAQLENEKIDICLSTFPIIHPEIEWLPLMDDEIFLSVPRNHRLAHKKHIRLIEVANEPFISMNPGYYFRNLTDNFCRQAGFEPNIVFEIAEAGIFQELVEINLGVTFTPLSLTKFSKLQSVQLQIEDPICKRTIGLAWHKGHYISHTLKQFMEFCKVFFQN